jgi:trk system potassium uptake protein
MPFRRRPKPEIRFRLPPVRLGAQAWRALLTAGAAGGVALLHGFAPPPIAPSIIVLVQAALIAGYYSDIVQRQRTGREPIPGQRFDWIDGLIASVLAVGVLGTILWALALGGDALGRAAQSPWLVAEFAMVWLFITEMWRLNVAMSRRLRRPGILFPLSFLFLVIIGTLLIKMPLATPEDRHLSWLDALFTMTSASCITGLVVLDTGTHFTALGHSIIAIFIQLGAIGFILFGSMVALLLGQRMSVRGNVDMSAMLQDQPVDHLRRFTRFIIVSIVLFELIGAASMYFLWDHEETITPLRRMGLSLFHAVSAFCNAGFELTGDSLIPYRYSALSHLIIAPLIILGAVGYPVLSNIASTLQHRVRPWLPRSRPLPAGPMPSLAQRRLTLHTKVAITTTVVLYLLGAAAIAVGQAAIWIQHPADGGTGGAGGISRWLMDATFMSITARSAGFNTMPMDEIHPAGQFSLMCLMFIGGSPGGAAGGIKTTAFAILTWSVIATIRQRPEAEAFGRSISDRLVRQAGTVAICYSALVVISTLLLTLSEDAPFIIVLFEAVRASTTTGLSLGLTPDLTSFGKVVIVFSMYLGRIGPLALFAALALSNRVQRPYAYPHETISLG